MKTLVTYQSQTGFTRRYAEWIAQALNADLLAWPKGQTPDFGAYDTVIYGGGFYAGRINGLGSFKKCLPGLKGKKVIVFATGSALPDSPDAKKLLRQNFTDDEWQRVDAFYFQSGISYERMDAAKRFAMKIFCAVLKRAQPDNPMAQQIQHSFDVCSQAAIAPLLECAGQCPVP